MNKLAKFVVCFLIYLGAIQTLLADTYDEDSEKSGSYMKFGAGLMVGGGILATIGGANRFENESGATFYSGVGVVAAGTAMLIWGLSNRSRSHSLRDSLEAAQSRSFVVGVTPLKKGGAAGAVLRW